VPTHSHFLPSSFRCVDNFKAGAKIDNRRNRDKQPARQYHFNNEPQYANIILKSNTPQYLQMCMA
jgi:hypothetical protein